MAVAPLSVLAFDPSNVTLQLGGVNAYGFADDTKISITKDDDITLPYEGVDGEISLAISPKTKGTMTISLQNTSSFNQILETWVLQSKNTRIIAFPVVMKDPAGEEMITIGWVQSVPDYNVSTEVGTRDWVIGVADANVFYSNVTGTINTIEQMAGII